MGGFKVLRVKKESGSSFSRHGRAYTDWYILKKKKEKRLINQKVKSRKRKICEGTG